MRIATLLVLTSTVAATLAFGSQQTPAPASTSAPAPTVSPASASVPADSPVAPPDAAKAEADARRAAAEEKIKKFGAGGYKPEVHEGTTVYCRKEAQLGSRFERKTCRTIDQLMLDAKNGKEFTDSLQTMANPKPFHP